MRLFALEQHISVIEDVSRLFKELGHEVDCHNLSGHSWVFNRSVNPGFGGIAGDDLHEVTPAEFHSAFRTHLSKYDAFISCYPPSFARLYRDFNKPVISCIPVRYEFPFGNRKERWQRLNETLRGMYDKGNLILVANNAYDQLYTEQYLGIRPTLIQSICDYVGVTHADSEVIDATILMETRSEQLDAWIKDNIPYVTHIRALYGRYKWDVISKYKAFVWIPYTSSIMSMYEHYWMGVPIFVPTPELLIELKYRYGALNGCTWNECCNYSSGSRIEGKSDTIPDPNDFSDKKAVRWWMDLYDCYKLPFIYRFRNWEHLKELLSSSNLESISNAMLERNKVRKREALDAWRGILGQLSGKAS